MKRICFIIIIICQWSFCHAQLQSQYRFQYGHELATSKGLFGVNFVGEYFPVDRISFAPSFSVLLPATGKASQIDLSGRYYFSEDKFQIYGLLGYGFYRRKLEFDLEDPLRTSSGIHFGGGALLKFLEVFGLNGEIKIQPQHGGEFVVKIGISYFIN